MSTDVLSADPAKNPTYYLVEDEDHHHESGGSTA
ncbi:cytochrome o ubiquinol oxidase subunit III, partial [Herbaspirillum sp. HC18]